MGPIKTSVFDKMLDQINEIFPDAEEARQVEKMLLEAEKQSRLKEIKITSQKKPYKKKVTLLKIRLYYGIHWKKPFYPFRLARNIIYRHFS